MNSTDALDNLIGLYASPLEWASAEFNAGNVSEDYMHNGTPNLRAFVIDAVDSCMVEFVELDCGIAVVYHG